MLSILTERLLADKANASDTAFSSSFVAYTSVKSPAILSILFSRFPTDRFKSVRNCPISVVC
jgi:hypothetical protein